MRNIRVRQHPVRLSSIELDRRGLTYLFCEVGNKRGFLVGRPGIIASISTQKFVVFNILEEKKYKPIDQYMRLQVGKLGTTYTDISPFKARIIGATQSNQAYCVWEIL